MYCYIGKRRFGNYPVDDPLNKKVLKEFTYTVKRCDWNIFFPQDLLKYTPHHHHDRSSLQTALTDLENVTHILNERKRESEELFQAKKLQKALNCKFPGEREARLVRQDEMNEMVWAGYCPYVLSKEIYISLFGKKKIMRIKH